MPFSSARSGMAGRAEPAMSAVPALTASSPDTVLNGCSVILPCLLTSYCLTRSFSARAVEWSPRSTIVSSGGAGAALWGAGFFSAAPAGAPMAPTEKNNRHSRPDNPAKTCLFTKNVPLDDTAPLLRSLRDTSRTCVTRSAEPSTQRQKKSIAAAHDGQQQLLRLRREQTFEIRHARQVHAVHADDQVAGLQTVFRGAAARGHLIHGHAARADRAFHALAGVGNLRAGQARIEFRALRGHHRF